MQMRLRKYNRHRLIQDDARTAFMIAGVGWNCNPRPSITIEQLLCGRFLAKTNELRLIPGFVPLGV
jgi:hypothetical protein